MHRETQLVVETRGTFGASLREPSSCSIVLPNAQCSVRGHRRVGQVENLQQSPISSVSST
jgi:hypothetical protein